ncbi:MAG TPA: response regulator [Nitrospiraceae bacterium]|nr:response regulator [Nitrospiraceae bacterium]
MAPKILVVDDEAHLRRVVSLYLRTRLYEVETAENGLDAIQKVSTDRPDLIIADIGMPGLDGYELCSRLRRDTATRTIPFIFLTARDQDTDRIKARKIGSDDYLTKPCPLDQLAEHVEIMIDRIEQAKKIPLDRIGLSGHLDQVNVLDLIQMLELDQKTGALVLSHGERTGTLYFKDGTIIDADIRSPKREEPLFVLLGWKAGRYLFLPDAMPERMPITASLAHLLFEDLRKFERHETTNTVSVDTPSPRSSVEVSPAGRLILRLEEIVRRAQTDVLSLADRHIFRLLVVGTLGTGKSELIQSLVDDLSSSRWAAVGADEANREQHTDFGLVRLSSETILHLLSVRAEKRFRPLWDQCLPTALGAILLINPSMEGELSHIQAFLKARQAVAPSLPLHALVVNAPHVPNLPGLAESECSIGSIDDQPLRLSLLNHILEQWFHSHPVRA